MRIISALLNGLRCRIVATDEDYRALEELSSQRANKSSAETPIAVGGCRKLEMGTD